MIRHFQNATKDKPELFWPWYNLAVAMDKTQRHSEAIKYYEGAAYANPSKPSVVYRRGELSVAEFIYSIRTVLGLFNC